MLCKACPAHTSKHGRSPHQCVNSRMRPSPWYEPLGSSVQDFTNPSTKHCPCQQRGYEEAGWNAQTKPAKTIRKSREMTQHAIIREQTENGCMPRLVQQVVARLNIPKKRSSQISSKACGSWNRSLMDFCPAAQEPCISPKHCPQLSANKQAASHWPYRLNAKLS